MVRKCRGAINWENDGEEIIEYAAKLYGSASRQNIKVTIQTTTS